MYLLNIIIGMSYMPYIPVILPHLNSVNLYMFFFRQHEFINELLYNTVISIQKFVVNREL